ncbi:hypothetical protein [Methylobacter sp.]|uniref:anti-sigma factor family protein n=1 Tax=Methylobacter sp. TaxID=2051955 RepID=UPI001200546A|nr:hypothetical protein [Methylobacter sp.]TAK62312.1 MAG: zf-HC2 domain-containing protein [Methylobacter sp.]
MNHSTSRTTDLHQQALLLLPWYMNQSLQPEERQQLESHIRHCLLCRRELVSLRKLAEAVTEPSDLEVAAETSFASLRSKLPARASDNVPFISSSKTTTLGKLTRSVRQSAVQFALAASLLLAIIPLTLHTVQTNTADNYYTLSAARPELAAGKQLRVIFAKSLSGTEVAAILAAIHGQRMDEPNSVGAFTVKLDSIESPKLEDAIALLRSRSDVLLAEPVIQP